MYKSQRVHKPDASIIEKLICVNLSRILHKIETMFSRDTNGDVDPCQCREDHGKKPVNPAAIKISRIQNHRNIV